MINKRNGTLTMILISLVLASTMGAWVYAPPAGSGNVHGTVLDENGAPLIDVKVMAYSNSGSLEATQYTDEEGYFRFVLVDTGQYTIHFEKDGYSGEQTGINVPAGLFFDDENDPVKMGEFVLLQNLRLTASVLSRVVSPGDTASFPFTVSILDEPEVIEFGVASLEGWEARVLDSTGEIGRAQLNSGSLSLTLEVDVPETAAEAETVSLTVIGSLNATLEFTIQPSQASQPETELASAYPYIIEELGRTISFPVTVTNAGDSDETVELSVDVPEGWETRFVTGGGIEIRSLFLESGDSEALTLEVEPAITALVGEYEMEIRAVSEEGALRDSLRLRVSLKEAEGEVELLSAYTDVTVEAGNAINYPLTIRNKGNNDDLFILTVLSAPEDWDAVFRSDTVEVSSLLISAGSYSSLVFEVTPPDDYEPGSYTLVVLVESEGGSVGDSLALGVRLRESFSDIEIVGTFTDVTVQAGSSITYPLRVWNMGESKDQFTMKVVSAPDNWDAVFKSESIKVSSFYIPADDYQDLSLVVEPPSNVETGDYILVIQVESAEGTLSEEIELKATVVGSHDVELELSTLYTTITIGDSVEFSVEVTNAGLSPLTSLYLETTVPADWDITVTPSQLASLGPKASTTFTISAETPSDTVAGDYIVTVQALSDQGVGGGRPQGHSECVHVVGLPRHRARDNSSDRPRDRLHEIQEEIEKMVENVIETFGLTKRYGDFTAVDSLDMVVEEGEIYGFLGPNGAGKTTAILMLMGLSVPTTGTGVVAGYDIIESSREVRTVASILPEYSSLYGELTAAQNLDYIGKLNDLTKDVREERIGEMLEIVGMSEWADEKYEKFSRGMRQRVGIAAALVKQPKIVFLDEPTLGLDPVGTKEVRELIIRLNREQGLTVVLISHLLNEVQMTCDRVGIINNGKLIVMETLENLTKEMTGGEERNVEFMLSEVPPGLVGDLESIEGVKSVTREKDQLFVYGGIESDYEVSKTITDNGAVILLMRPKEYSLEEIFMKYYEEG